jgi:hypothetical protein
MFYALGFCYPYLFHKKYKKMDSYELVKLGILFKKTTDTTLYVKRVNIDYPLQNSEILLTDKKEDALELELSTWKWYMIRVYALKEFSLEIYSKFKKI